MTTTPTSTRSGSDMTERLYWPSWFLAALLTGLAGALWIAVHYASGFGALEARVVQSAADVPREVAGRFVGWNTPIHFFHAATLTVALGALLTVPLAALRRR